MLERLRLADTAEWVTLDVVYQVDDAQRLFAVALHPPRQASKAAGSNSKLRTDLLEWYAFLPLSGLQQTPFHVLALQQVSGLYFGFDLTPQLDGHDNTHRIAIRVGYVLYCLPGSPCLASLRSEVYQNGL